MTATTEKHIRGLVAKQKTGELTQLECEALEDHERIVTADALEQAEQALLQANGGRRYAEGVGRRYELEQNMHRLRETLHGLDGRGLEDFSFEDYQPLGDVRLRGPRVSSDSARGWSRSRTPGKKSGPKRKVKKASELVVVQLFMKCSKNKIAFSRVMVKCQPYFLQRASALCERYADEAWDIQRLRREFLALASTCRK